MIAALVGEGGSDRVLLPILRWVWEQTTAEEVRLSWVDTSRIRHAPGLAGKLRAALELHPCDVLFVHRDSDRESPDRRRREIASAAGEHPHVPVIPVRMTEAWLLFDEAAIRSAAGRPGRRCTLRLPPLSKIERLADPKRELKRVLETAHGATGRRARQFRSSARIHRLADLVEDWSPLRQLPAFQRLEADTRLALERLGVPLYGG